MGKLTITGKELRAIGYPEGPVISMAMNIVHRKFKHGIREEVMKVLKEILEKPEAFEDDAIWASIAGQLMPQRYPNIHHSEWAWIGQTFNYELDNNGTVEELYSQVNNLLLMDSRARSF